MWVQQYQFTIIAILLKSWLSKLFVWVSIRLSKCQVRVTWTFWFFEFTWTSLLILDFFKLLLDSTQLNYLNRTLINTYFNIEINQHYLKPNNYKPQNKPLYIFMRGSWGRSPTPNKCWGMHDHDTWGGFVVLLNCWTDIKKSNENHFHWLVRWNK